MLNKLISLATGNRMNRPACSIKSVPLADAAGLQFPGRKSGVLAVDDAACPAPERREAGVDEWTEIVSVKERRAHVPNQSRKIPHGAKAKAAAFPENVDVG